jgi:SAM-dependent methyltransferase
MKESGYILDKKEDEARRRLGLLERYADPGTIGCLDRLGVAEGWSCLELGAGGGSIARWLCRRVGSSGRVVAVDADTRFLRRLEFGNLEVREHDIAADALEEAAYDLVHARNLLVHVREREELLGKMGGAVRPLGWILVEEPDIVTEGPDPTASDPMKELYGKVTRAVYSYLLDKGLDPHFGSRLFGRLRSLGFERLGSEGRVHTFRGGDAAGGSPHVLAFAQLQEEITGRGVVTGAEFAAFLELFDNPSFAWREGLTVAAWGRRPSKME